jgi:hypothetical protein
MRSGGRPLASRCIASFPKVPLGWRKVTLEWEDGYWYMGRNSAPHDYWRVRFW